MVVTKISSKNILLDVYNSNTEGNKLNRKWNRYQDRPGFMATMPPPLGKNICENFNSVECQSPENYSRSAILKGRDCLF